MRTMQRARRGAISLCVLASISGCVALKPDLPPPVEAIHTVKDTVTVKELHYLPLPAQVTAQESVPAYPDRPMVNKDLAAAIADRDAVIARQNAKLAAAECLGDALPGSTQAKDCLQSLKTP